ncbi:MAG: 50S ribosomal protein L13 [Patescibacteria group bacterium]
MIYTIDAKNKSLGRIASEVAFILRGKNDPVFRPNVAPQIKLKIINLPEIKITGKKLEQKKYIRHSGYPGKQKTSMMKDVIAKRGIDYVLLRAVRGMLPKNKLRDKMMKNIIIE